MKKLLFTAAYSKSSIYIWRPALRLIAILRFKIARFFPVPRKLKSKINLKPRHYLQLSEVLFITIFWLCCGAFLALYRCVSYDAKSGDYIFAVPQNLLFLDFLLVNLIGPAIGGLIGSSVLIFLLNDRMRRKSFGHYILVSNLFYFTFIFTLNTIVSYFFYYREEIAATDNKFFGAIQYLVLDLYAIRNVVTWMIITQFTLFGWRIYQKYGAGAMFGLIKGEYFRPKEVERVFMFLDLTDSTTIAENLGHIRYFDFLRDFFVDITDPVLNSQGEIYQYVGDEVVISWPTNKAVFKEDPHCIACFFRIEEALHQREYTYINNYGIVPGFKASVHMGNVVAGEIGVTKREIVYSGDILNTCARMLELCKVYNQRLIISREVIDMVKESKLGQYQLFPLGEMPLRGKTVAVELYGVRLAED